VPDSPQWKLSFEEKNVPRVKRGTKRRASRKKVLQRASGFFLTKSKLHRSAQEAVEKALRYAFVGRRRKKRDFRSLWILRIGAGTRAAGLSYSKFMSGLKKAGIELNRKMLAHMAATDEAAFLSLVDQAKAALAKAE
jgi:large subunit ribosomal protein L20